MPHVSKFKPSRITQENLANNLSLLFSQAVRVDKIRQIIPEILTPTEQIMIAKRISSIYLLEQGHTKYGIGKILKLSESTLARISVAKDNGAFSHTESTFTSSQVKDKSIINTLDALIKLFPSKASKEFRRRAYHQLSNNK